MKYNTLILGLLLTACTAQEAQEIIDALKIEPVIEQPITQQPVAQPTPPPAPMPTVKPPINPKPNPFVWARCPIRWLNRKSADGPLLVFSENTRAFKLVTPALCGQADEAVLIMSDNRRVVAKFCGIANENRAHYCSSVRTMPIAWEIEGNQVPTPKRCANKKRCE
jgi:hypothetical protein